MKVRKASRDGFTKNDGNIIPRNNGYTPQKREGKALPGHSVASVQCPVPLYCRICNHFVGYHHREEGVCYVNKCACNKYES